MKPVFKSIKSIFAISLILGLTACSKPPTEGIVQVYDLAGNSIPGATVVLTVNGPTGNEGFFECNEDNPTQTKTYTTGTSGATPAICFKLPAVISVAVTTGDGKSGVGTLSLTEEETETATVKVN